MKIVIMGMAAKNKVASILIACIFLSSVAVLLLAIESERVVREAQKKYEEGNKPTNLDVIVIKDSKCVFCYNEESLIDEIMTENITVGLMKVLDYKNSEAVNLISKYEIKKIPAVIIAGNFRKDSDLYRRLNVMGEILDGVFVFRNSPMPYTDAVSGKSIGNVKVLLISAGVCDKCYNHEKYVAELKLLGIPTSDREVIDYKSARGSAIVKEQNIKKLPTFVLTGDIDKYAALNKIQDHDSDMFVLRNVIGPYLNLDDGLIYDK